MRGEYGRVPTEALLNFVFSLWGLTVQTIPLGPGCAGLGNGVTEGKHLPSVATSFCAPLGCCSFLIKQWKQ